MTDRKRETTDYIQWTLSYVVAYLAIGGLGFALFPKQALDLFQANKDYDDIGFRLAGMMMVGLAYLVFTIVRNKDWKYYPASIALRSAFVIFMFWLFSLDQDPMFIIISVIVLIGLIPSLVVHFGLLED